MDTGLVALALVAGTVVLVLALAVATSSASFAARMRRAGPTITRLSGALLVLAGAYVTWYGWFEIRVLSGQATNDQVVSWAIGVQAQLTRWVAGLGTGTILVLAVILAVGLVASVVAARRRRRANAT